MTVSVFVGTSLDGFLARPDGVLDFLPADGGEPHGYNEFLASVDAIVIGRNTFETVRSFDAWPYGNKHVVVLSHRPVDLSSAIARGGVVEQMASAPAEIVAKLAASGAHHLYVDGGSGMRKMKLVVITDSGVLTRMPKMIQIHLLALSGGPPWKRRERDLRGDQARAAG